MGQSVFNLAEFPSATTATRIQTLYAPGSVVWDINLNLAFIGDGQTLGGNLLPIESMVQGLVAAGTTQGTALQLVAVNNIIATAAASSGVVLPVIVGQELLVINRGANTLNVYPPVGAQIDALAVNTATTVATVAKAGFFCASPTQYYTIR